MVRGANTRALNFIVPHNRNIETSMEYLKHVMRHDLLILYHLTSIIKQLVFTGFELSIHDGNGAITNKIYRQFDSSHDNIGVLYP